jgi:tetratricopeptide (TPR) repeat protein
MSFELMAGTGLVLLLALLLVWRKRRAAKPKVDRQLVQDLSDGNYEAAAARELAAGNLEMAFDLFVRGQNPARAAQVAQRLGRTREAAELYERAGDVVRAAVLYRQVGLVRKAEELSLAATSKGADAAGPVPGLASPADRARKVEAEFDEALRRASEGDAGARSRAEELGHQAAEAWLAAGDARKSAEVCRRAGLVDQAINLYANVLGDPGSAAQLLADRGDHRRAAELYEAAGQKERALAAWIDWGQTASDPFEPLDRIDRLGADALNRHVAAVLRARPLEPANMDLHYRAACALQDRGRAAQAAPLLQQIKGLDPNYRDVQVRLTALLPSLSQPPAAEPAAAPASAPEVDDGVELPPVAGTPVPTPARPGRDSAEPQQPRLTAQQLEAADIQRIVSEAAVAAARQAVALTLDSQSALGPVVEEVIEKAPTGKRRRDRPVARGVERVDLSLDYAADSVVEAAKSGPSVDELMTLIGGRPAELGNIEVYYRLGLAQMAAGRWSEAREAFAAVEQASPGYRDASRRLDEVDRWRQAVAATDPRHSLGQDGTGRYTILGELGRGGMAVVYRARDESLGREVALKFMAPEVAEEEMMLKLFQREARAVAGLNHPNIVTVYDVGVLEGRPFLAMELVEGHTVEDLIEAQGKLPVLDAVRVAEQVLSALEFAHSKRIIHRDIKPANMMRARSGLVKVMDFGLAKSLEGGSKTTIVAGSPPYMAPEQLTGRGLDERVDLFAVGVSMYEMLAGQRPFDGLQREKAPPPLHVANPAVPRLLERLVQRALEFEPDKRFVTATEMLQPLRQILDSAARFQGRQQRDPVPLPAPDTVAAPPLLSPLAPEAPSSAAPPGPVAKPPSTAAPTVLASKARKPGGAKPGT